MAQKQSRSSIFAAIHVNGRRSETNVAS